MHPYAWPTESDAYALVPALSLAYFLAARRYRPGPWRIACFAGGLALLVAAFATPLDTLALNYLVTAHFLQNVAVAEWAPALLVLALPPALAQRVRIPMLPALVAWVVTYFAWHVPTAYDFALRNPHTLLHLEHLTYFIAGAALWWPVFHGPHSSGTKALYLFGAFVLASPLGLLLSLLPDPVYAFYETRPTVWGLSHLLDQEIAGTTMAAEQAVVFFAVFAFYFRRFVREEEAPEAESGRLTQRHRDDLHPERAEDRHVATSAARSPRSQSS